MKKTTPLAVVCALTWFGHACGASMATGRLAVQYCSSHGLIGLLGAVVVWVVTVGFAWIIMEYGRMTQADTYHDVVNTIYWPNPVVGKVMNVVWDVTILYSTVVVSGTCVAGSGALLETVFGINYYLGMLIFVALMLVLFLSGGTVLKKLGGISFPMLVLLFIMCIGIIYAGWDNLKDVLAGRLNASIEPGRETVGSMFRDAVTYGMTQSGFVATGIVYSRQFKSRKETNLACGLGFLFGCLAMVMCTLAALAYFPVINNENLPYLTILLSFEGGAMPVFRVIYYVVLYIAYCSTSGSLMLGCVSRYKLLLGKFIKKESVCVGILIVFILCASTLVGALGLKTIVDKGYALLGTVRSYTWFYPLLVLGPISIYRVGKMLKATGTLQPPYVTSAVSEADAQETAEQDPQ